MGRLLHSLLLFLCLVGSVPAAAAPSPATFTGGDPFVGTIDMNMMILPGTSAYLRHAIDEVANQGGKALVVRISTPGGMLTSAQEMIQTIFQSPIPVVIYVSPGGGTATSAGVFITLAGHVAAMAPGTSMGSAHPVQGDGKDIEGDMRKKAEEMAVALVKSIAEQRGRNVAWAEKSVKESNSITEKEALKMGVVDIVAEDIPNLLRQMKGREVRVENRMVLLEDYSNLPLRTIEMSFKDQAVNVLANPNIAAMLWLGATTGLTLELYNPGATLPGVVGIICLVLALAVSEIIPLNQGGILLFVLGAFMLALELYVPSGVLAVGGVIAMLIGAVYLVDVSQAPDLAVSLEYILPLVMLVGGFMLFVAKSAYRALHRQATTGAEGLIGQRGRAISTFTSKGKIFVNGEVWDAAADSGIIEKDAEVEVLELDPGFVLKVKKIPS